MITDFLFLIIHLIFSVLFPILKAVSDQFSNLIPNSLYTSINTLVTYFGYFNGAFPVDTLFVCIGILMSFYIAWYTYKVFMWVWSLLPHIGKSEANQLPQGNVLDLHKSSSGSRVLDLRRGRSGKGNITMKDIQ